MEKQKSQEFTLQVETELRIETSAKCTIQLKAGFAEVFGTELSRNKEYMFPNGTKMAVFTWHGCTLVMTGNTEDAYISSETPMVLYVNIQTAIEQLRVKSELDKETPAPRVMVVGPDDVGKSTLCKMLLNWAVRVGRSPIFVDLDVNQNAISLPGTISALVVERTANIEEGYNLDAQIVYSYGCKTPNENPVLYKRLISCLSDTINMRSESLNSSLISGIVVNTGGWIKDEGYNSLKHAAIELNVNLILVIDQERLRVDLTRDLKDLPQKIKVLSLPKSGGVVTKSQDARATIRNNKIREYFYGVKSNLYPISFDIKFDDIKLYKIGAPQLPDSLLPMGMNREDNDTKIFQITPHARLVNHILAVSHYDKFKDEQDSGLIEYNIAGYLVVTKVDTEKRTMGVLSPQPKPLPNTILLLSDIQFVDLK